MLIYAASAAPDLTEEALVDGLVELFPEEVAKTIVATLAERWKQEGFEEGLQKGKQQGAAALALRLLQKRFGQVSASTAVRVCSLSVEQLEELGPALFDIHRLEDLAAWLQAQAK
jgi:predicted transposase YdaD